MAERPLLATDRVALAIRSGAQTQDRRPVKPQPTEFWDDGVGTPKLTSAGIKPPWQPGDLLYVREAHQIESGLAGASQRHCFWAHVTYRADGERLYFEPDMEGWSVSLDFHRVTPVRPNIHMPKWAARTWVRVSRVWVERVRDISVADALAEGVPSHPAVGARGMFAELWESLYPGSWAENPWVWACEFEREEQGR